MIFSYFSSIIYYTLDCHILSNLVYLILVLACFKGVTMNEDKNIENETNYEFVTETIKKKPINKKRAATKVVHSILLGILAGVVACVVFVFFAPRLYNRIHPDTPDLISIPEDVQEEDEETEVVAVNTQELQTGNNDSEDVEKINIIEATDDSEKIDDSENSDEKTEEASEAESESNDKQEKISKEGNESVDDSEEEQGESEEEKLPVVNMPVASKEPLTLEDYKTFYDELNGVSAIARRSLTKVKGVTDSTDWFNNSYESKNVSTGLIVADNGKELLIVTNSWKLVDSKEIEVTFCDGRTYNGTVKKADSATNLVVVAVVLDEIEEVTKNSYATANLGNSMISTIVGRPVIAIGSPLGIEDSMAVGVITSNVRFLEHTDNNIRYLTTDIYGSTEGSGVLIDLDGRVLGIIFQGGTSSDTRNLIHAYSISDIKSKVEKMSNGQDIAYLGIIGTDVTKEAIDTLGVPEGTYVKQVVVDSPAMKGGIQNGDVIVKIGTSSISTFKDFKEAINKCQPGDTTMVTVERLGKDGYVEFSYEIYLEALK